MYWFFVLIVFLLAGIKTEKPKKYQKVSVIIPAYNEEDTVAQVVEVVKKVSFVDEIIVVNDGSSDNTEGEATKAGAIVINHETNKGKGEALYTGYQNAECDIIAFIDADIYNLTSKKVEAIIKPILLGKTDITKTKFARESGRVTELTAKPLLNFFFPEISFEQPLSGQFAARKEILKKINFEKDYGVDVGIVIDADVLGISIMEVDIGAIQHDMSPLSDLNMMANEVVRTIMSRANKYGRVTMIDEIGYFIRMSIVGLSFVILGLFTIFFVKQVPLAVGVLVSVAGLIIAIYYMVILSWDFIYFLNSFTFGWGTDPSSFFTSSVGGSSDLMGMESIILPTFIGCIILWVLFWLVSNNDVDKGIGLISRILMPLLFIIMSVILVYSFTLPGFDLGVKTLFTPNWNMLLDINIWLAAFAQIIFSLSMGQAIALTYASYLPKASKLTDNVLIVVASNF